jgi:hypothetical protein
MGMDSYRIGTALGYASSRTKWEIRVKHIRSSFVEAGFVKELGKLISEYSEEQPPEPRPLAVFMSLRFVAKICYHPRATLRMVTAIVCTQTPDNDRRRIAQTLCLIADLRASEPAAMFREMLSLVWVKMIHADRLLVTECWKAEVLAAATKEVLSTRLTLGTWLSSQIRNPRTFCNLLPTVIHWHGSPFVCQQDNRPDTGWPSLVSQDKGFEFSEELTPPSFNQQGRPWKHPLHRVFARIQRRDIKLKRQRSH